jgi:hypothetical protein
VYAAIACRRRSRYSGVKKSAAAEHESSDGFEAESVDIAFKTLVDEGNDTARIQIPLYLHPEA